MFDNQERYTPVPPCVRLTQPEIFQIVPGQLGFSCFVVNHDAQAAGQMINTTNHTNIISMKSMKCGKDDLVSDMIAPREEKTKHLFGSVKVGERGQIVIPKEAREIFGIRQGDILLVLGDVERGIALVKADAIQEFARKILDSAAKPDE
jgi:AbrB family looped-hinge helix DNA binding protein